MKVYQEIHLHPLKRTNRISVFKGLSMTDNSVTPWMVSVARQGATAHSLGTTALT